MGGEGSTEVCVRETRGRVGLMQMPIHPHTPMRARTHTHTPFTLPPLVSPNSMSWMAVKAFEKSDASECEWVSECGCEFVSE